MSENKAIQLIANRFRKISRFLFLIGLLIEIAVEILGKSDYSYPWGSYTFRVTFVLFLLSALLVKRTRNENLLFAVFFVLGLIGYKVSGRNDLLRFTVFTAALSGQPVRRTGKWMFYASLAGSLLLAFLSVTGIFGKLLVEEDYGNGPVTRLALGFGHPNALHCMFMMLILLALYLYADRMKWYWYLFLLAADAGLFVFTRSAAGCAVTGFALLACALVRYVPVVGRKQTVYILTEILFAAVLVFSVWAAIDGVSNPFLAKLDGPLTGRISSLWESKWHEGTLSSWTWFGRRDDAKYFDMGWVRLIYWYGVMPAAAVIALIAAVLRKVRQRRDAASLVFLASGILYTAVEAHLVSRYIGRNYLLLVIAAYLPLLWESIDGGVPETAEKETAPANTGSGNAGIDGNAAKEGNKI